MSIDWDSPRWGCLPDCVHLSDNGSDIGGRHDLTSGGEH